MALRILFTGASSFPGFWFVRELAASGHEVTAVFRQREYPDAIRRKRVATLEGVCRPVYGCSFGDAKFVELITQADVICHHAADVTNYKSPDFNVTAAVENNTHNIAGVCAAMKKAGGRIVLTGSVFEQGEGAGSQGLPAFSPYGL